MDKELINSHTKIKICGMTCEADIKAVNTYLPDYIGFVLFFPKSNRNISFDSKTPGSGKIFDWSLLDNIRQRQKTDVSKDVSHKKNKKMIFLAGGIDETNVKRAISQVAPDVIDLSSAVEKTSEDGTFHGKDPEKIRTIVTMVHD